MMEKNDSSFLFFEMKIYLLLLSAALLSSLNIYPRKYCVYINLNVCASLYLFNGSLSEGWLSI